MTGVIKNITRNEIPLESGKTLRPDTIVTATGLKLRFAGGIQLSVDGGPPVDVTKKFTWKGVMIQRPAETCLYDRLCQYDVAALVLVRLPRRMKKQGVICRVAS